MKKLFLFLGAALFSLGVSATEYNVTISDALIYPKNNNDIDITPMLNLGENLLKAGDEINVTVKGYFSVDIQDVLYVGIVDNSQAADYWTPLSDMEYSGISMEAGAVANGTECEATVTIPLIADAITSEKIIVRLMLKLSAKVQRNLGDNPVKLRATFEELSAVAAEYPIEMPTGKFQADGTKQFKMEINFETAEVLKKDDILNLTISGTFNADVYRIAVMVFEGATEVLPWTEKAFKASKDVEVEGVVIPIVMTNAFSEKTGKLSVTVVYSPGSVEEGGNGETVPDGVSFLKTGEEAHDPVELAKKDYTDVTLAYNQYADPANYQFIEASVATGVQVGDYVTFSVKGESDTSFTKMIAYLRNPDGYSAISAQVVVAQNVAPNGEVTFEGVVEATSAAATCDLVFEITDEATEGTSITIKEGSSSGPGTAIDGVATSAFAVVGGMVYSAGDIVVYNVAGKEVAKASKAFNVNSLAAGVYFITAPEGTIKFVK